MSGTLLACETCGASLVVGNQRTAACPYCASPSVVERPATVDRPNPAFVIAFGAGDELPKRALATWVSSQSIFADSALSRAKVEDLKGIYVPAYLYSAVARSSYSAEIGEEYQETETYTVTVNGKTETRTRTVTKTEYRSLHGEKVGYVTDVIVTASKGLPNAELEAVEPFDLRQLRRYDPALISGWLTEEPSHVPAECMALARGEAVTLEGKRLSAFMPGDSHRELVYKTRVEWETLDPVLVPVWVLAVRYRLDKPPLRIVVNGQTGQAAGKAPLSPIKIGIAVMLAVIMIIGIVVLVMGGP